MRGRGCEGTGCGRGRYLKGMCCVGTAPFLRGETEWGNGYEGVPQSGMGDVVRVVLWGVGVW